MRPRLLLALAGLVALALVVAVVVTRTDDAPSSSPPPTSPATPEPPLPGPVHRYVALGDSYTAGPLIPWVRGQPTSCLRSSRNYPALLAEWLQPGSVVDVSCSGADTRDLSRPQQGFGTPVAPQLDAVTADTDLVTLGMGGNDFDLFGSLVSGERPAGVAAALDRTAARLAASVRAIGERAPDAVVALVGYPRIVPERGTCAALPFDAATTRYLDRVERALNDAVREASERAGAVYVDTYASSFGHDVCAGADAWVNGRTTRPLAALAYHPFETGMAATATAVHEALRGKPPTTQMRRQATEALAPRPDGTLTLSGQRLVAALLGG